MSRLLLLVSYRPLARYQNRGQLLGPLSCTAVLQSSAVASAYRLQRVHEMRALLWLAGPITALQHSAHVSTRTALTTPSTSDTPPVEIYVCTGRDCLEDGSRETLRRFKALKDKHGLDVKLRARPCMGPCGRGPNIDARRAGVAVKSPGTGVTLWTDVADDRRCATILAAAGEQLVVPENYESAPPRTLAESASKFYRGYWKQINNVLFACTIVGVDWLYQERPEIADEYSLRIGAGLVLWQLCIRAAQGRMYVRASERDVVK